MILLYIFLAVVAAVAIKISSAATPSKTAAVTAGVAQATPVQSPTFYNNALTGGGRQISQLVTKNEINSDPMQVATTAKPQLVITSYSPQLGSITWISQYAKFVQGIGYDKSVLFEVPVQDGSGSGSYVAGQDVEFINVIGSGGNVTIKNTLPGLITPSTYSPSDDFIPPSGGLTDPVTVLPDPATAVRPYPASTETYIMPSPSPNGAMNPDNAIILI